MRRKADSQMPLSDKEIAISVRNLSKEFKVYQKKKQVNNTNASYTRGLTSLLGKSKYEKIQVLKDVSFDVMKGEMVGILGRNGAGKSTLLKILGGIIEPTSGTVKVNGTMSSLIGLQAGLDRKLTARENILQYGLVLGLPKEKVLERVDDVLEFAEIQEFADIEVSHFSSGMNAKLAFSTSLLINPDILLLDEILAVGDYYFYQKSIEAFENIRRSKGTIILVSHALAHIKQYCDRVMLLHDGKIELIGQPDEVIKRYLSLGLDNDTIGKAMNSEMVTTETGDKGVAINEKTMLSASNTFQAPTNLFPDDSPFLVGMSNLLIRRLRWRARVIIENNDFAFKDKSVLDVRCQNGEFMFAAFKAGARFAEGIEKEEKRVITVKENFRQQNIAADKYKVDQGNLLGILRNIKPGTFDTIICNGIINRLTLLNQIVRIKPSYVIIDADISESSNIVTRRNMDENMITNPRDINEVANNRVDVITPNKAALEQMLNTYKFKYHYIDWGKVEIENWQGLEDYLKKQRITIIATL